MKTDKHLASRQAIEAFRRVWNTSISLTIGSMGTRPRMVLFAFVFGAAILSNATLAGASSPADRGVTVKTINVGVPYINYTALRSYGINLQVSSSPDAYGALIANMNAHGGVDGRRLVPYFVEENPALPSSATAACSQLTQDDKAFIVLAPVYPDCFQQTYDTPTIAGTLPSSVTASSAPNFSLVPPASAYDPVQLAAFAKAGVFKGKRVAVFIAADPDKPELAVVQSALKKLHVDVVLSADASTPVSDTVAADQQIGVIAQRFQDAGVNEVVAIGGAGSTEWPIALQANQSTYKPPWIATSESTLLAYAQSAKTHNPYLQNVLASTPVLTYYQEWQDPAIQKCAAIVHKAYPSDKVIPPINPRSPQATAEGTNNTFTAVEFACQYLAIFAKIANAAGKHLTVSTFTQAGYSLRHITLPGSGGPVSFGPNRPYAIGTVHMVTYDPETASLVPVSFSATK